jgi:hypothetical protein
MTLNDIRGQIEGIKETGVTKGDDECGHVMEDNLVWDFIRYISKGGNDQLQEKAKLIQTSLELDFSRWYA